MKVSELAAILECPWEGEDTDLESAAALGTAGPNDLSFVGNRKAAARAAASGAGCLIVPGGFPEGRTLIRAREPRAAFARAVRLLHPEEQRDWGIDAHASIAASAIVHAEISIGPYVAIGEHSRIAARTRIGAGSAIGARVSIGEDCTIYANVTMYDGVSIGARCVLHSGCVIGADGFGFVKAEHGYEKFPQIGTVEIGDDVEIGANSCIDRAALGTTQIGNGTKLDNMVHVAHNCRIGKHVVVAAQTGFSGGVTVEDYAVIGGQVGIGDKARIESGAVLGSGSGVLTSKIVRRGQTMWGTPARPLKDYLEQLATLARLPGIREEMAEMKRELRELRKRAG